MNHLKKETNVKLSCDINTHNEIILLRTTHISWIIPIKPIFCFIFSPFYFYKAIKTNTFCLLNKIKVKFFFYAVNVSSEGFAPQSVVVVSRI